MIGFLTVPSAALCVPEADAGPRNSQRSKSEEQAKALTQQVLVRTKEKKEVTAPYHPCRPSTRRSIARAIAGAFALSSYFNSPRP